MKFTEVLMIVFASMVGTNLYYATITYIYGAQTYGVDYFLGKMVLFAVATVCVLLYRALEVW